MEHKTLLHYAVAGNLNTSRYDFSKLLGKQSNKGVSALMIAVHLGSTDWVQYLLEHEAGLLDNHGRSSLI